MKNIWIKSGICFTEKKDWWTSNPYWDSIFQWIKKQDWLSNLKYYTTTLNESPKEISWKNLANTSFKNDNLLFFYDHKSPDKAFQKLELAVRQDQLYLFSEISKNTSDVFSEEEIEKITSGIRELGQLGIPNTYLESSSLEVPPPFDFLKPRPVFRMPFRTNAIVDIISKSDLDNLAQGNFWTESNITNLFEVAANSKIPKGLEREVTTDTITIYWSKRPVSEEELRKNLTVRHLWWAQIGAWPLEEGWNQHGDKALSFPNLIKHDKATLYHPNLQAALLAIVPEQIDKIGADNLLRIKAILQDGAISPTMPIKNLFLILPDRESAKAIATKAKDLGIRKVFYAGNNGIFWSMNPSGNYLSPAQQKDLLQF